MENGAMYLVRSFWSQYAQRKERKAVPTDMRLDISWPVAYKKNNSYCGTLAISYEDFTVNR